MNSGTEFKVGAFPPDFKERVINGLKEKSEILDAISNGKRAELIEAGKITS